MKIQILERGGKYCVRWKSGLLTNWFWKYYGIDGWDLWPDYWTTKEIAERNYNTVIAHNKDSIEFKAAKTQIIQNETILATT